MPNKFVFPGGRRDPADTRLTCDTDLRPEVLARLRKETRARVTDNSLRGLALAAIRETFEETGLILGEASNTPQPAATANGTLISGMAWCRRWRIWISSPAP